MDWGGPEQTRRGQDDLFGIQNSRKAYMGMLAGLQDPNFMRDKRAAEAKLKAAASSSDAKLQGATEAWKTITEVQQKRRQMLAKTARCAVMCMALLKLGVDEC